MSNKLDFISAPKQGALDFVALGALIHRLDTGVLPFRKASECKIHISGGEYNCAVSTPVLSRPWLTTRLAK